MIFVIVYFVFCIMIAVLGVHKPLGFWGYLVSSIVLTPLIGLLLIAAGGRGNSRDHHADRE